jgi:hypothetical protein
MPREARLFTSSAGSAVRGYLKYRANIPPRWIKNARGSRKRIEPEIAEGFRSLKRLRIRRPRARVAIRTPSAICARYWFGGKQPTAKRTFIEEYESCWNCSGAAQARCKNGHELEGQMQGTQLRYAIKFVADMDKAVRFPSRCARSKDEV